jgi:hypothetical protein
MVQRNRTVWKLKRGIYEAVEWGEVEVSDDDTIVFDCLTDSESPYNAVFWKMSDGTEVGLDAFGGDNEVQIDEAGLVDTQCIYMIYGVKA